MFLSIAALRKPRARCDLVKLWMLANCHEEVAQVELEQSHNPKAGSQPDAVKDYPLREKARNFKKDLTFETSEIGDILLNFLSFNPYFRLSAFECLISCKLFDNVRDPKKELFLT